MQFDDKTGPRVPEKGEFVAVTYPDRNRPVRILRVAEIEFVGPASQSGYLAKFGGLPPIDLFWVEPASQHHPEFATGI